MHPHKSMIFKKLLSCLSGSVCGPQVPATKLVQSSHTTEYCNKEHTPAPLTSASLIQIFILINDAK